MYTVDPTSTQNIIYTPITPEQASLVTGSGKKRAFPKDKGNNELQKDMLEKRRLAAEFVCPEIVKKECNQSIEDSRNFLTKSH